MTLLLTMLLACGDKEETDTSTEDTVVSEEE